jgi:hypothetical protein
MQTQQRNAFGNNATTANSSSLERYSEDFGSNAKSVKTKKKIV